MKHYIDLIKEHDEFYYISYSNEDILESIEGGAFYIDFILQNGKLRFLDIFHNVDTTKFIPIFLLNYIEVIENKKIKDIKRETLKFFSGEEVVYSESTN